MISFMPCYVSWTSLIDLRLTSLQSMNIRLMKKPFIAKSVQEVLKAIAFRALL